MTGQPTLLKDINRTILEKLIFEHGPITKPMLAKLSKLSLPTVNKSVDALVEVGVIIETESVAEQGIGRKAKFYVSDGGASCVLAVSYHDNKWEAVACDLYGRMLTTMSAETEENGFESVLESLCSIIDKILNSVSNIKSIGVGIPGVVMPSGMVASIPLIPSWEGKNIKDVLQKKYKATIFLENDIKLITLGYYQNKLSTLSNIVYFYIGTGVGAGIIINSQLYKGNVSFAGELGYMVCDPKNKSSKASGSLEKMLIQAGTKLKNNPNNEKFKLEYCENIANSIINIVAVLNPDAVVLDAVSASIEVVEHIRRLLCEALPAHVVPQLFISDNNDYGILGLTQLCISDIQHKQWTVET